MHVKRTTINITDCVLLILEILYRTHRSPELHIMTNVWHIVMLNASSRRNS